LAWFCLNRISCSHLLSAVLGLRRRYGWVICWSDCWYWEQSLSSCMSFECCPWALSSLRMGYLLIGCWYWEQSLSSLYAASELCRDHQ
jgi:hypothetical protein